MPFACHGVITRWGKDKKKEVRRAALIAIVIEHIPFTTLPLRNDLYQTYNTEEFISHHMGQEIQNATERADNIRVILEMI